MMRYINLIIACLWLNCGNCMSNDNYNAAKVPALLVFGDSIVDTGNNNYVNTVGKANFPPYGRDFEGGVPTGRYSNGKLPSDLLVEALGIKQLLPPFLDPKLQTSDLLTGVSFASGGSGYDPDSAKFVKSLPLDTQLELFRQYINKLKTTVGDNTTTHIISKSIYLLCAGSNDITIAYYGILPFKRLKYSTDSYTSLMVHWASAFLQELYSLGARKIAVASAPPSGCLPSQRTLKGGPTRDCSEKENTASILFNKKLSSVVNSLNQKLRGSRLVYLNIYDTAFDLITNPSKSGFRVADRGCCGTGNIEVSILCNTLSIGTCKNASEYVFFDSFHPTEATYRIIVNDIYTKYIGNFL